LPAPFSFEELFDNLDLKYILWIKKDSGQVAEEAVGPGDASIRI